jgi:hypothetical protein
VTLDRDDEKTKVFAETRGNFILGNRILPLVAPGVAVGLKLLGVVESGQNSHLLRKPVCVDGCDIGMCKRSDGKKERCEKESGCLAHVSLTI